MTRLDKTVNLDPPSPKRKNVVAAGLVAFALVVGLLWVNGGPSGLLFGAVMAAAGLIVTGVAWWFSGSDGRGKSGETKPVPAMETDFGESSDSEPDVETHSEAAPQCSLSPSDVPPSPSSDPGAAQVLNHQAVARSPNFDMPPRDAAERLTFATWAIVTGESPGGIFKELPKLDDARAAKMAERLSERVEGPITTEDVLTSENIEALAQRVRSYLEADQIDGFVRTLRARPEGSSKVPVFVFHPVAGSTLVYDPLLNRLPEDTPMYGLERVEGTIEERAAQYVPKLIEMQGDGPYILAGWSLGGVLAYACAIELKRLGKDVAWVGLIDAVRPGEEVPQTKEEVRKRWDRYARFAEKTFNVTIRAISYEQVDELDDEGQIRFVLDTISQSGVHIPAGIIEHQRTAYLDNRAIDTAQIQPYDGYVTLYMADRYHDDAIVFEPRYAVRKPDGGWGEYVSELEVVPIGGEHMQVIEEPIIAKVGAHMTLVLIRVQAEINVRH